MADAETTSNENRTEQVNLKLKPSEKRRWEEAAEERGDTLSLLIRTGVEAEISGGHGSLPDELAASLEDLASLADGLADVPDRLENMDVRLAKIDARLRTQRDDFRDLANDVLAALPEVAADDLTAEAITKQGLTVDRLAKKLGVEPWQVYGALDHLRENTSQVRVAADREGQALQYVRRG